MISSVNRQAKFGNDLAVATDMAERGCHKSGNAVGRTYLISPPDVLILYVRTLVNIFVKVWKDKMFSIAPRLLTGYRREATSFAFDFLQLHFLNCKWLEHIFGEPNSPSNESELDVSFARITDTRD